MKKLIVYILLIGAVVGFLISTNIQQTKSDIKRLNEKRDSLIEVTYK